MNISGFAPTIFAQKVEDMKERNKVVFMVEEDDDEEKEGFDCIAENLRAAVEAYQDKILQGLFALTDEEVEQRIADFKVAFEPQASNVGTEPTQDQIAAFEEALESFTINLKNLQLESNKGNESLLTSSGSDNDDDEYARFLLPSNPLLQQSLKGAL